ncbi:MAG: hypothetical protein SFX18_11690 [Pirellulales bacterium]|nr:hypothetical protein [Pirellulales bacterium]
MLNRQLSENLLSVAERLIQLARQDVKLREDLVNFANDFLDELEEMSDDKNNHEEDREAEENLGGQDQQQAGEREGGYEGDYRRSRYEQSNYNDSNRYYPANRSEYGRPGSYEPPSRKFDAPSPRGYDSNRSTGYERPPYESRGNTYERPSFDRGGNYERGANYDRGPSYERGGNFERGPAPRGSYETPRGYDDPGRSNGGGWDPRNITSDKMELTLIEDRCKLKAKGARWAAERRRMINSGADFRLEIDPKDREIIALAKQIPECFLWMNHPSGPSPANLNMFDDLAGCFEVLGETAALLREMLPDAEVFPDLFNRAMELAAEAQSALRSAVYRIDGPNDNDQNAVFHWLKRTASALQIFIQRYMRADDTANPTKYNELRDRIVQLDKELGITRKKDRDRAKHLSKVRPLVRDLATLGEDQKRDQWQAIAHAVDDAINGGLPVTDSELRALLSPFLRQIPGNPDYPEGFSTVLREYEHISAAHPASYHTDEV